MKINYKSISKIQNLTEEEIDRILKRKQRRDNVEKKEKVSCKYRMEEAEE